MWKKWVIGLVVVLLGIRIALPFFLKWKINQTLGTLQNYTGQVEDVDLALWRGSFDFDGLEIRHRHEDFALTIQQTQLNLQWKSLLRRAIVFALIIDSPRLRMQVAYPTEFFDKSKKNIQDTDREIRRKTGRDLPDLLASLMPFQVDEFIIKDGVLRLEESGSVPMKEAANKDKNLQKGSHKAEEREKMREVRITDFNLTVHNITNSRRLSENLMASGELRAKIMDASDLKVDLRFNPTSPVPTFDLRFQLSRLDLRLLNPIFRWQWGVDVENGFFSLAAEATAADGGFKGYLKPVIENLDMVNLKKDKKSTIKIIKEVVVGAVAGLLQNPKEDIATRIPFSGKFDDPAIGTWEAVQTVLINGFITALKPGFDRPL